VEKSDYFNKYEGIARKVLCNLLEKYKDVGIIDLESTKILENSPFNQYGSVIKIAREFGGKPELLKAMKDLQNQIYMEN
jgi:type I restriction enzyme R subunit